MICLLKLKANLTDRLKNRRDEILRQNDNL